MGTRQVACERPYGGKVQGRQDVGRPSLGNVAQQDEAVSRASHERASSGKKNRTR